MISENQPRKSCCDRVFFALTCFEANLYTDLSALSPVLMEHSTSNAENFVLNLEGRSSKTPQLTTTAPRHCESECNYYGYCGRHTICHCQERVGGVQRGAHCRESLL